MKKKRFWGLLLIMGMVAGMAVAANPPVSSENTNAETGPMPRAVVVKPGFSFDPVVEGTVITHEYQIENQGQATLDILKVKTSCGCTTADYTRHIQPGDTGKVLIKGNTSGYGDRLFQKTISVHTNDPKHPDIRLAISGKVETFALIEPGHVVLRGQAGEKITTTVVITPIKKYPFEVTASFAEKDLEDKISFAVEKSKDHYLLVVSNLCNQQGAYRGDIHLTTDSNIKPDIRIPVYGMLTNQQK